MSVLLQRTLNIFIRTQGKVFRTEFNVGLVDIEADVPPVKSIASYKFPEDFDIMSDKSGVQIWETLSTPVKN